MCACMCMCVPRVYWQKSLTYAVPLTSLRTRGTWQHQYYQRWEWNLQFCFQRQLPLFRGTDQLSESTAHGRVHPTLFQVWGKLPNTVRLCMPSVRGFRYLKALQWLDAACFFKKQNKQTLKTLQIRQLERADFSFRTLVSHPVAFVLGLLPHRINGFLSLVFCCTAIDVLQQQKYSILVSILQDLAIMRWSIFLAHSILPYQGSC